MKKIIFLIALLVGVTAFGQTQGVSLRSTNGVAFQRLTIQDHLAATNTARTNTIAGLIQQQGLATTTASAAFGLNTLASGTAAFVTGNRNQGHGAASLVGGQSNVVSSSAFYSLVGGELNQVNNRANFVSGSRNSSDGVDSAVIGADITMDTFTDHDIVLGRNILVNQSVSNCLIANFDPSVLFSVASKSNSILLNAPGGTFFSGGPVTSTAGFVGPVTTTGSSSTFVGSFTGNAAGLTNQHLNLATNVAFATIPKPSAPTVALGGAGLLTGSYVYQVTFYDSVTNETLTGSGANSSSTINPTNQQVVVTIPTSTDPRTVGRRIYRLLPTGEYGFVGTVPDNTTTTFNDNLPDASVQTVGHYLISSLATAGGIYIDDQQVFRDFGLVLGVGRQAGPSSLANQPYDDVFVGDFAGRLVTSGAYLTIMGNQSGYSLTSESANAFFGTKSGNLTTASRDSFFGSEAGRYTTTGNDNSFFGNLSGVGASTNYNTTGSSNTFLGAYSGLSGSTQRTNLTVIGAGATGDLNNAVVLGRSSDIVYIPNKLGIGVSDPGVQLAVGGSPSTILLTNDGFGYTTEIKATHASTDTFHILSMGNRYLMIFDYNTDTTWFGTTTNNINGDLKVFGSVYAGAAGSTIPAIKSISTNNAILKCPDGGSWILRVANDGTLSTVTNSTGL